jgi:DNA invertase Pin-like site-specific DNA recombinase
MSFDAITQRGAGSKSLKDIWADTTSSHGRLMLTVLAGLAEFERELIRARTGGRAGSGRKSEVFVALRKLTPHQRQEAFARLAAGEEPQPSADCNNASAMAGRPRPLPITRRGST